MDYRTEDESHQAISQYGKALLAYLRRGVDAELEQVIGGNGPDGGYPVSPSVADRVGQLLFDKSPFRRLASVQTITTDALTVLEGQDRKRSIPTHELFAQPKITQKELDDPTLDIDGWLAEKVSEIFARRETDAFIHGTGVGQPRGVLSYAKCGQIETIRSGVNGEVTAQGVVDLIRSLPEKHRKSASFILNRTTAQAARSLQAPVTGEYLWQPGLSAGAPDTLAGVPVQAVNEMPSPEAGSLSVALGNFAAGYWIVERAGVRVLRDSFTDKPFVKFFTTKRVGGDVVDRSAIKVLRLTE